MAVAPAPLPTTISTRKSSIAMYSISSAGRDMRWISSRNRTSPSDSEDRMAARSPACWMAGPLLIRSGTFISAAMIMDSVVLPRPGGPESSTWSALRPRIREASRTRESCLRTRCWPTKSCRFLGRRAASMARSSGSSPPPTRDGSATGAYAVPGARAVLAQPAQRGAEDFRHGPLRGEFRRVGHRLVDAGGGVLFGPTQARHGGHHLRLPHGFGGQGGGAAVRAARRAVRDQLPGQFEHDPAGDLGSDAGDLGERLSVTGVRGDTDRFGFVDGQDGQRQARPHTADTQQHVEDLAFVVAGEAKERQRVLPHDQGGTQLALIPDAEPAEGLWHGEHDRAVPVEGDHRRRQADVRYGAAEKTDQGLAAGLTARPGPAESSRLV